MSYMVPSLCSYFRKELRGALISKQSKQRTLFSFFLKKKKKLMLYFA